MPDVSKERQCLVTRPGDDPHCRPRKARTSEFTPSAGAERHRSRVSGTRSDLSRRRRLSHPGPESTTNPLGLQFGAVGCDGHESSRSACCVDAARAPTTRRAEDAPQIVSMRRAESHVAGLFSLLMMLVLPKVSQLSLDRCFRFASIHQCWLGICRAYVCFDLLVFQVECQCGT